MASTKPQIASPSSPVRERKSGLRPGSSSEEKGIWSKLLDSVATGKKLPEKRIVVLGGTTESQAAFVEAVTEDPARKQRLPIRAQTKKPPVANQFALGYTYQDILDVDHDDILARLSLYLLADYSPSFGPLLEPLFTPVTIPNCLVVILLDWASPIPWLRQLRDWIRLLRSVLKSADDECQGAMEENMKEWRERRKFVPVEGAATNPREEGDESELLGPGAWDEALGVPLCVVCQNAEKIEKHEKERNWKDDEFDFIFQYIRTVLLKHGASLIYTASAAPGPLRQLIHSTLGIQSLLQRNALKPVVYERDKVLVPPNWDSWGKIRVQHEGLDIEAISQGWSIDIQQPQHPQQNGANGTDQPSSTNGATEIDIIEEGSCIPSYEETLRDPSTNDTFPGLDAHQSEAIEVECMDTQEFLTTQQQVLEKLQKEDEREQKTRESKKAPQSGTSTPGGRLNEHIGPVQFNMGGIQVDADDMLKGIKEREAGRTTEEPPAVSTPDSKLETEKLASFFAGLVKRGGSSSPATPTK